MTAPKREFPRKPCQMFGSCPVLRAFTQRLDIDLLKGPTKYPSATSTAPASTAIAGCTNAPATRPMPHHASAVPTTGQRNMLILDLGRLRVDRGVIRLKIVISGKSAFVTSP